MKIKHKLHSNGSGYFIHSFQTTKCGLTTQMQWNPFNAKTATTGNGERAYQQWKDVTCKDCLKGRK